MKHENGNLDHAKDTKNSEGGLQKILSNNQIKNLFKNDFILNLSVSSPKDAKKMKPKRQNTSKSKDHNNANNYTFSKSGLNITNSKKAINISSMIKNKPSSYIKITSVGKFFTLNLVENQNIHQRGNNNSILNNLKNNNTYSSSELTGLRLYKKGVELINQKQSRIKKVKNQLLKEQNKFHTFTPIINKKSTYISSKVHISDKRRIHIEN